MQTPNGAAAFVLRSHTFPKGPCREEAEEEEEVEEEEDHLLK